MDLDQAIRDAWNGRAVLFVGAGFSKGAVNVRGSAFKVGAQLAEHFTKKTSLPPSVGLEDAADEFLSQYGPDALMSELQQEFTVKRISSTHVALARVPWKRVYTTNYDNVIEEAFAQAGKASRSVTLADDIKDLPKDATLCVHLNGFVGRLSRTTVLSDIKLTDSSYLTASVAESSWTVLFRQDLDSSQAAFFLGYSVSDLDIRRVLFEHDSLKEKSFFVLGPSPDLATARRAGRFGTVIKEATQQFATKVAGQEAAARTTADTGPIPFCIQKYDVQPSAGKLEDRFIFELLLYGKVREDFIWKSVHSGDRYCLVRSAAQAVMKQIEAGRKAIVVHSDLGNGKSLILETLKSAAARSGRAVFTVAKQGDTIFEELEKAFSISGNKLFVIDNYPEWLDVLKFFGTHAPANTSLVVTARTVANDVLIDRMAELLKTGDIQEIEVDRLSTDDLNWLITYFNDYGLWGGNAAWSRSRKLEYLQRVCGSQWHAILIKLFESPQIEDRLQGLFKKIRGKEGYADVVVALLVLTVIGYSPSPDTLVDLCGQPVLDAAFRRDPVIRELIDFNSGEIRLKSSVAGQFILQRITDPNLTVKVLTSLAKSADKSAYASQYYFGVLKNLMRYSNLQALLPEDHRGRATLAYYESIKGLGQAGSQPLFWLQYAIASLVLEEFGRAEKYFQTAYSLAESRDYWDSFQIDNHYARFLLARAIKSGDASTCMQSFREARKLIHNQIERERLHYGYRVAALYADFYDRFSGMLKPQQRDEIRRAAKHICERIAKLPEHRQEQRYVRDCSEKLKKVAETSG